MTTQLAPVLTWVGLPAPPIDQHPQRFVSGRVELQIFRGATLTDRIAGAVTLLAGTPFHIAPRPETPTR